MKRILTAVTLTSVLLVGSSFAAQHEPMSPHMGEFDEQSMRMHNDRMEVHLEEMQALMDKLHVTSNSAERRGLLIEHRIQMAEMMGDMRSSREDMMMGMMGGRIDQVEDPEERAAMERLMKIAAERLKVLKAAEAD